MKNIILTLSLLMVVSLGYSQIKVETSGNVGIGGISNPTTALDVNGDMKVLGNSFEIGRDAGAQGVILNVGGNRSADGAATFDLIADVTNFPNYGFRFARTANGSTQMIHRGSSTFAIKTADAANVSFFTNSIERIRVKFDGNIGIGVSNPTHLLTVADDIKVNGVVINSDRRLKNNVSKFNYGLDEVLKMKPINYKYNGEGGTSTKRHHVGIMAQDLQKIAPELVTESLYIEEDAKGKSISEESYLEINDTAIKYMLVNAIKEQQNIIDTQNNDLAALKNEMEELQDLVRDLISKANFSSSNTKIDLGQEEGLLFQNYPNPSDKQTSIEYFLPSNTENAVISTYDIAGKLVRQDRLTGFGKGILDINSKDLGSGAFVYQLSINGKVVDSKKMVIE